MLRWLVRAWKAYTRRAASYQTRALLAITYAVMLGPGALIGRMSGTRLLDLKSDPLLTSWIKRGPQDKSLDALRRQF